MWKSLSLTSRSAINFLSRNKGYFSAHTFGGLPLKFIQRLGSLSDSQYLDNQVSIFEYQRDLLSKAENYLYVIIPQIPLYLIDSIMPRLEAKTSHLKYLPKRRHNNLKHSAFYELLNSDFTEIEVSNPPLYTYDSIGKFLYILYYILGPMNSKLYLMAVAVIAAFGIAAVAAVIGPVTIATPALAQNMTGGNMTAGNITAGNMTGGNVTG